MVTSGHEPCDARIRGSTLAVVGAIFVAGIGTYAGSLAVPFIKDDQVHIVNNALIRSLYDPVFYLLRRRGIVELSFTLNYLWGGLHVWMYHAFNLLVHLINAYLVVALVRLTSRHWPHCFSPAVTVYTAGAVALVFVLHPLQTNAVTYVVQRSESLASTFYLAALLLFALAIGGAARAVLCYALAIIACYLAVMTKEMAATAPFSVFLYDFCFVARGKLRRIGRRWIVHAFLLAALVVPVAQSLPYLIPSSPARSAESNFKTERGSPVEVTREAASATTTGERQLIEELDLLAARNPSPGDRFTVSSAGFTMPGGQPLRYLATQLAVILWYMRLFVLPTQLCFDYGWPLVDSFRRFDVIGPGLLLIALLWAAVRAFSVCPLVTFCVLWFFVILAPTSSIIPIRDVAAEHRVYLAIVPLSWVLVSVAGHTLSWSAHRWPAARGALVRAPALILFFGWLVMLGWLTVERNRVFQDRLALAADTARKAPHNWSALHNLGNAYADHGRIADAVRAYQAAIDADPSKGSPRINLAQILAQRGQRREAEEQLKRATQAQVRSVSAKAFLDLGRLYEEEGRWQAALAAYRHALQRMPEWAEIGTRMRMVERRVRESEGR